MINLLSNINKKVIGYLNKNNEIEYDNYNYVCNQLIDDNIERFDNFFYELGSNLNNTIKTRVNKVIQDNNNNTKINEKYIEDIKFFLMNKSKQFKKDVTDYINEMNELIL